MKECKDCHLKKSIKDFYGVQGECKDCTALRVRRNRAQKVEYYRKYDKERQRTNITRILKHRYTGIRQRVEGRATRKYRIEGMPVLSSKEWLEWNRRPEVVESFNKIYKIWVESGFKNSFSPSIDRINNSLGYTVDNMQWLSKIDNNIKRTK